MQEPPRLKRVNVEETERWLGVDRHLTSDRVVRLLLHLVDYEKYLRYVEGVLKEQTEAIVAANAALAKANLELLTYANDLEKASGECSVPLPQPGTDMARLVVANMILKRRLELVLTETARRENERS